MSALPVSRRRFLWHTATALGTSLALPPAVLRPALAAGGDQGIGGTGFSLRPADEESDRGIGGTGVIGTIRKFGSIIVNDLRISYPKDVKVRIDGRPAKASDLKIGQVVRVAAAGEQTALSTRLIDVTSEVVGPVEAVTPNSMIVLGQNVATAGIGGSRGFAMGQHIAVCGLRRLDGTIVASHIEPAPATLFKVAGPLQLDSSRVARIGHLTLTGVAGLPLGDRIIVEGQPGGQSLAVTKSTTDLASLPASVKKVSIEAYAVQNPKGLRLGSGQPAIGQFGADFQAGRPVLAVITAVKGADGVLKAEILRAGPKQFKAQPAGAPQMPFNSPQGPGRPQGPANFGQSPAGPVPPYGGPVPPIYDYGPPSGYPAEPIRPGGFGGPGGLGGGPGGLGGGPGGLGGGLGGFGGRR